MVDLSVERGLVRAFYPEHVSCLSIADPTTDDEWGLVCNGCGAILGSPDDGQTVATPQEAHDAEALSGSREGEPAPDAVLQGLGLINDNPDPDDWAAAAAEEKMAAEQERNELGPQGEELINYSAGYEPGADPEVPEVGGAGVPYEPVREPDDPIERARGGSEDDPPWDDPDTRMIAHEPVINDMPPDEEQGQLPAAHGSVEKSAVVPQDPIMAALDVIDPTRPYSPAEVEAQLVDLEARLERGQHFQRVWEERAYRTKLAFTMAYEADLVRIYDETRAPQDIRQAQARQENKTLYEDMTLAEMMVKAVRESMHNLRSQLSGYQSIARSVGASMTGNGYRT